MVKLTIDSKEVEVPAGTTILDAAKSVQIKIPTLCHHPDLPPTAACGICIVKAGGRMVRSCCTPVAEGMEVEEVIRRIKGIQCHDGTSCPDQLATALQLTLQ